MFYVYILRSLKNGDVYVGYSDNLRQRYKEHNNKRVKSTRGYVPWELIYYEAYKDKKDAARRERQLKNHRAKEDLKIQLYCSLGQNLSGLAERGPAPQGAVAKR